MYGLDIQKKLRLRIYDPKSEFAMLEMKQKQGKQQRKRSLRLTREDAIRIIGRDYSPLLRYPEQFALECYVLMNTQCYSPRTIVEYNRKAFIAKENKIRVTFDHHITATQSCFDLFATNLALNPVMDLDSVVLEVKYNGFLLSYIKQALDNIDRSELSVSKYCLARQSTYYSDL